MSARSINRLILFPEHYPGYFAVLAMGTNREYMIRRSPCLPGSTTRIYAVITETAQAINFDARTINELIDKLSRRFGETAVAEEGEFDIPEWALFDGVEPDKSWPCACGCGAIITGDGRRKYMHQSCTPSKSGRYENAAPGRRLAA